MEQELSKKLNDLLNSPEGLSKISELMAALGANAEPSPETPPPSGLPDLSRLMPLLSSMGKDNEHTALLKALRPYLHGAREKRLDDSVKLLQLLQLLPLLQQGGLF